MPKLPSITMPSQRNYGIDGSRPVLPPIHTLNLPLFSLRPNYDDLPYSQLNSVSIPPKTWDISDYNATISEFYINWLSSDVLLVLLCAHLRICFVHHLSLSLALIRACLISIVRFWPHNILSRALRTRQSRRGHPHQMRITRQSPITISQFGRGWKCSQKKHALLASSAFSYRSGFPSFPKCFGLQTSQDNQSTSIHGHAE